jgi:hypothetical protein
MALKCSTAKAQGQGRENETYATLTHQSWPLQEYLNARAPQEEFMLLLRESSR